MTTAKEKNGVYNLVGNTNKDEILPEEVQIPGAKLSPDRIHIKDHMMITQEGDSSQYRGKQL